MVAPGVEAVQGVVEAEGEGAEWTERLVAATVSEQGAPEVVIQDVGPGSLGKKVRVGLDGSAGRTKGISQTFNLMLVFCATSYYFLHINLWIFYNAFPNVHMNRFLYKNDCVEEKKSFA